MPVVESNLPADASCAGNPLFRVFHWGADVDVIILDGRSCRSQSVEAQCEIAGFPDPAPTLPTAWRATFALPPASETCLNAINDPSRTMLGGLQKQLFKDALLASTAKFKFVMNPVPIQQFYLLPYDRWEGYAAERAEILNFIRQNAIQNVVFLTTDTHANLVNEVFVDSQADNQTIAQEVVAGPVATSTLGDNLNPILEAVTQTILTSVVGIDCRHLDKESFGWVEFNSSTGTASITIRDETGAVITDQLNNATMCSKTLGP
jgi:phosphodiesterase/alkaline phosphatase D-like protein